MTNDLARLADLHASGALNDAEYAAAKASVINAAGPPAPDPAAPKTPVPDPPEKGSLLGFWVFVVILVLVGAVIYAKRTGLTPAEAAEEEAAASAEAEAEYLESIVGGGSGMDGIERQVAADMEDQYRSVVRSGSSADRCVHAGMVAAAYLQANDSDAYERWKATERTDCAAAGVPR